MKSDNASYTEIIISSGAPRRNHSVSLRKLNPQYMLNPACREATSKQSSNGVVSDYMGFILYSVAGLACGYLNLRGIRMRLTYTSVVRFLGSTSYMIVRLFAGE